MQSQNHYVPEDQIIMFEIRLAPMCGITDHIFRTLCFEQGCDLAYTEMISAMGYLCAPEQQATKELGSAFAWIASTSGITRTLRRMTAFGQVYIHRYAINACA